MKKAKQGIRIKKKKKGEYKKKKDRQTKRRFLNDFTKRQKRKNRGVK